MEKIKNLYCFSQNHINYNLILGKNFVVFYLDVIKQIELSRNTGKKLIFCCSHKLIKTEPYYVDKITICIDFHKTTENGVKYK